MEVLAALDLFGGKVVRLTRGQIATAKVYSTDPVATALGWQQRGASALHLVDLDAALGLGANFSTISRLLKFVTIPIQLGGGIRNERAAREWFERGVARLVLGTLAMRDPDRVERLVEVFGPERIVVALDFSRKNVVTEGWTQPTSVAVEDAFARFLDRGVRRFLVTAVERDGTLSGPDFHIYARLSAVAEARIFASGGISTLSDVLELRRVGVAGVVIGKALYEGKLTLEEICQALAHESEARVGPSKAPRRSAP